MNAEVPAVSKVKSRGHKQDKNLPVPVSLKLPWPLPDCNGCFIETMRFGSGLTLKGIESKSPSAEGRREKAPGCWLLAVR